MKNLLTKNINWRNILWELIIVFIGLLAALYVDSLMELGKDRKQETIYLGEIKENIESDIKELEELLVGMEKDFQSIQKLNIGIKNNQIDKDSLVFHFGRIIFIKEFRPNFTALNVIMNKGDLDIIQNQKLLYKLNQLREFSSLLNRSTSEIKDYYTNKIEPFMMKHFDLKDYVWNDTITINTQELIQDQYFQNLVLLSVQKWGTQLQFHRSYKEDLEEILDMVK